MIIGRYLLLGLAVLSVVARASSASGWRLSLMLFLRPVRGASDPIRTPTGR